MSSILEIVALVFAFALTVVESKKTFLSSSVLLVFWLLSILASGVKLRTLAMGCPSSAHAIGDEKRRHLQAVVCLLITKVVGTILVFALECVRRDAGIQLGDETYV